MHCQRMGMETLPSVRLAELQLPGLSFIQPPRAKAPSASPITPAAAAEATATGAAVAMPASRSSVHRRSSQPGPCQAVLGLAKARICQTRSSSQVTAGRAACALTTGIKQLISSSFPTMLGLAKAHIR